MNDLRDLKNLNHMIFLLLNYQSRMVKEFYT